jgi:hypothetical protein
MTLLGSCRLRTLPMCYPRLRRHIRNPIKSMVLAHRAHVGTTCAIQEPNRNVTDAPGLSQATRWFCCGLAGVLGFWSPEAEPGGLVIIISFHEYLKSIFQVQFEAGAWIGEYKGHAPLYLWNLTIKLFTLALLVQIAE